MNELRRLISEEIRQMGPMSFARFMELALYCPNLGYYEHPDVSPGKNGDFYTSVSVGKLFGQMLGFQFAEWLKPAGGRHQLVEAGAHDGTLAKDILTWIQSRRPELFETTEYWIIEPSAVRRASQERTLASCAGKVKWWSSWESLPTTGVQGVIFSNELLDAFPAHRLRWDSTDQQWTEWVVTNGNSDDFAWTFLPMERKETLRAHLPKIPEDLLAVFPNEFTVEISPAANDWWRQAASRLKYGRLLAFDYGLERDEFFVPERAGGTLRAYYQHRLSGNLLANPGGQDLTYHVDFSAIRKTGEAAGLITETWQTQSHFLIQVLCRILANPAGFGEWGSPQNRQFQTLTHPEHLGRAFRTLVQTRNLNPTIAG